MNNDITNQYHRANDTKGYISEVFFNGIGLPLFSSMVDKQDTFTITTEEEITEDTKFKYLIEIATNGSSLLWEHSNVNQRIGNQSKEFHAYIDGEFKLIWTREKGLVE